MKLLFGVLLFIGVLAVDNASSSVTLKRIATDQLLMKHLMQTKASDADNTLECFSLYTPIVNDILEEYSKSYQLCSTNAAALKTELDNEAKGNQTLISTTAQGVCNTMTQCSALDDSLEFLDCYSEVGGPNIKTVFDMTYNASEVANNLREEYFIVQANMERCENASKRAYAENESAVYAALSYCLENGPPEVATTTEAPTTTTIMYTSVPEEIAEEEELSRNVQLVPKVMTLNQYIGQRQVVRDSINDD